LPTDTPSAEGGLVLSTLLMVETLVTDLGMDEGLSTMAVPSKSLSLTKSPTRSSPEDGQPRLKSLRNAGALLRQIKGSIWGLPRPQCVQFHIAVTLSEALDAEDPAVAATVREGLCKFVYDQLDALRDIGTAASNEARKALRGWLNQILDARKAEEARDVAEYDTLHAKSLFAESRSNGKVAEVTEASTSVDRVAAELKELKLAGLTLKEQRTAAKGEDLLLHGHLHGHLLPPPVDRSEGMFVRRGSSRSIDSTGSGGSSYSMLSFGAMLDELGDEDRATSPVAGRSTHGSPKRPPFSPPTGTDLTGAGLKDPATPATAVTRAMMQPSIEVTFYPAMSQRAGDVSVEDEARQLSGHKAYVDPASRQVRLSSLVELSDGKLLEHSGVHPTAWPLRIGIPIPTGDSKLQLVKLKLMKPRGTQRADLIIPIEIKGLSSGHFSTQKRRLSIDQHTSIDLPQSCLYKDVTIYVESQWRVRVAFRMRSLDPKPFKTVYAAGPLQLVQGATKDEVQTQLHR